MILSFIYFYYNLIFSELVFKLSSGQSVFNTFIYMTAFLAVFAIVFALICNIFSKNGRTISHIVISLVLFFYYAVELVYQHIFKSFLSIAQVGMGTDAISTYKTETIIGIKECAGFLFLLLIPFLCYICKLLLTRHKNTEVKKLSPRSAIISILIAVIISVVVPNCLIKSGNYSPYEIYHKTFVLSRSQDYFGCLTSTRLELRNLIFGTGLGSITDEGGDPSPVIKDKEYGYNVLDIDFDRLAESNQDERTKTLDTYFASKLPTQKNKYTGMFKDYNVITVMCESFSPYLIDEERTPTLYKMANEGIVFNNYYSTISDNTSNSEYVLLNSLLPDTSLLGKGWQTFYEYNSCTASVNNLMPNTLNNIFKEDGFKSLGFHYYYGSYYGRNKTHPNFGMDFYYMTHGLKKTEDWPTSDLEMMQQSVPYYLKKNDAGSIDRFCTYYLTFSGHMQYRFDTNNVANRNKEYSDGLPYEEAVRAYVSCNQELEKAMAYLVDELDDAGVLDNTLIILLPDHYPYTLGLNKLSQLADKDLLATDFDKEFNQYEGCLLMWSSSMKEPIVVDDMMCELDILPTTLNLLGIDYDSRLLMGTDIFSNSEHIAILGDRSFITDKIFFNATTGETTKRTSEDVSDEYINRISALVKNKFTISTEILYTDYYRHAYGVE